MPGKVRKCLRDKTLHNVLLSGLSETDKHCIIEVFVNYEHMLDRVIAEERRRKNGARYIDAELLVEEIAKINDLRTLSTKTIGEAIDKTPTADVVEKEYYDAVIAGQETLQKYIAEKEKEKLVLQLGNKALRWCLIAVKKTLLQIRAFAESNDFAGDMFIAGEANEAIDAINYQLDKRSGNNGTIQD